MAEEKCTGACIKCSLQQQVYCAAQRTHGMIENQRAIVERLDRIMDAIMGGEVVPLKDEAQNPDGAKE